MTCRYRPAAPAGPPLDAAALYPALARVVARQPMLRVGILGQDTGRARFSHLAAVDLRDHVAFQTLACDGGGGEARYEALLAEAQCRHHDRLWPDLETRAPWRLVVLQPGDGVERERPSSQDVLFAFHHSIMDGASGKQFHELLLAALDRPGPPEPACSSPEAPHLLSFPDAPALPEGQEDAIPFRNSIPFVLKTVWNELGPSPLRARKVVPWHGAPIDFRLPHTTRARPVDIPPEMATGLLGACRRHAVSLTALLHALVLASLARRLPADEAASFAGGTPISLRPYFGPGADAALRPLLRTLLTGVTHAFPAAVVAALREPAADVDALVWDAARAVKAELAARQASLPADDIGGLMQYVGDWSDFWNKKDGQPRPESWSVSNLGVLPGAGAGWSITRLYFTNGAMVAGAPIGVNVGSVAGGTLTVSISWQDAVVPAELMYGLAGDLAAFAKRLHETGKFAA